MASQPPREWFEENFAPDGEVTYCSGCHTIPFAFIGHPCTGIEAILGGWAAERVTVPYRWEDVRPVENGDRPGDWCLVWTGTPLASKPTRDEETGLAGEATE